LEIDFIIKIQKSKTTPTHMGINGKKDHATGMFTDQV